MDHPYVTLRQSKNLSVCDVSTAPPFFLGSLFKQWFTDTMAAGYGAEVGDDVKMFMKWMGL